MKNGLLVYNSYNNIFNIGDYIQSLAASQYFDSIDIYLNRELLSKYKGEETKLIMNGWFMHEPQNWPPSKDIIPFFISFHINSVSREHLLNKDSLTYLKSHEPIGCRDKNAAYLLKSKGIDAYFSGCLTLTLAKTYKTEIKSNKIYFVDPYFDIKVSIFPILKKSLKLIIKYLVIRKISSKLQESCSLKNILKTSFFYSTYSKLFDDDVLLTAEYIKHEIHDSNFKSEDEKFKYAKMLLAKYSTAKFVITSRIHCALPCLSFETPVIYVENKNQSETSFCRLDGLQELFHTISYCRGSLTKSFYIPSRKIGVNFFISNKKGYQFLINKLITQCQQFVK